MAKVGGTLTADVAAPVLPANMSRKSIYIHNLDKNDGHIIYVEFDGVASTVATDDSWAVQDELVLSVEDYPEIRGSVSLKSTHGCQYVVRTEEAVVGAPLPAYVPPTVVTYEVYGVNLTSDSIYLADSVSVALGTKFKVTTPGTLQLDGVTPVNYVTYYVADITTEEIDEETYKLIRISSREDRSRIVDVTGGPVVDEENEVFPAASGIILTVL